MSVKSQGKNMVALAVLLEQDLSYIHGARESGPNGAKKEFLSKGAAFLRALGKDLGLQQPTVHTNPAGIAVSGEVYLRGMWPESGILFLSLEQMPCTDAVILYRVETADKGMYRRNYFISRQRLASGNYPALLKEISMQRKGDRVDDRVA